MFYVGQKNSLVGTVHLSPLGGMTLCGILVPARDRLGREWWRQEFETPSIPDVLRRVEIEREDVDPPCENCLRIAELHPHRLIPQQQPCTFCGSRACEWNGPTLLGCADCGYEAAV